LKVTRRIRVLIVDDSLLFRETLASELGKDLGIEIIGTASDPFMARDKILELKPDVVTLDVEMPKMDGITFLRKLMPQYPLPVVVISSSEKNIFDALDAGAVDFVKKPDSVKMEGIKSFINELIVKIKIASTANLGGFKKDYIPPTTITKEGLDLTNMVVAIGASTGGTEAIYSIVTALPRDMPGIVIVQHMPPVFTKLYAERLNNSCRLEVKEAENGDLIKPGRVLIAPGDLQMQVQKRGSSLSVKCFQGERVSGHCPSVDVLFDSMAEVLKDKSLGVILTGMGSDGAKGLLNMKNQGAYTIGQDEKTSIVYGMPMVSYNIGAVMKQLPLDRIPQEICKYLSIAL
jgi:two-component system chemotaxis response regulator CheB